MIEINPIKPVKIDTTAIREAGATVCAANNFGAKLACTTNLSVYKMRTLNGAKLASEDLVGASQLVSKMTSNGWLNEDDKAWCHANGIAI